MNNHTSWVPCSKCGTAYPRTAQYFHRDKSKRDGLRNDCKGCCNAKAQAWYQDNADRAKANMQRWRMGNPDYDKSPRRRARKRAANAEWRKANPDKVKRHKQNDRARHRGRIYAQQARWRTLNQPRINAQGRIRYWRNLDYERARSKRYRLANPEVGRQRQSRRRARKYNAGGRYTKADIQLLFASQKGLCWWCDSPLPERGYHIDHRIPLARGGSNEPGNLCLSCPTCNHSKNAKMPWEWNGRLL